MLLPILQVHSEDIPEYAVVCGDPKRAERIASRLDNVRELAFSREYRTFVGTKQGVALAVVSHGVGSPGAAVCFEELIRAGVRTIIRVGTAGSYSADTPPGSLIVSTAAAREEGLTRQLVPRGFPAVADSRVVDALFEAASASGAGSALGGDHRQGSAQTPSASGAPASTATDASMGTAPGAVDAAASLAAPSGAALPAVRKGITITLDAFFAGVEELPHKKYKQAGVLAVEMEIAALYVVASLRGARAGAIVSIDGFADADLAEVYNPHTEAVAQAVDRSIDAALQAVVKLSSSN